MAESAVGGEDEDAEGDAGRGGSEERRLGGGARAFHAGAHQVVALSAQLLHAGEIDEAVVDSGADHDGAEERGLRVEISDGEAGDAESDGDRGEHRDAQADGRSDVAEEKQDGEQHYRHAEQRRVAHVVDDGLVLGDEEREAAGESDPESARVDLRLVLIDERLHLVEELSRLADAQARARRPHHDGERLLILRKDEEAVLVAGEALQDLLPR